MCVIRVRHRDFKNFSYKKILYKKELLDLIFELSVESLKILFRLSDEMSAAEWPPCGLLAKTFPDLKASDQRVWKNFKFYQVFWFQWFFKANFSFKSSTEERSVFIRTWKFWIHELLRFKIKIFQDRSDRV